MQRTPYLRCTGAAEHAHKPLTGSTLGLSQVSIQHASAYMFRGGVETLRIDGYLTLKLLTHGELVAFQRLIEYGEPLSMGKAHPSTETYSYKCTAGLKTLLVEYLLMIPIPEWRREEPQDERRVEGGEWWHPSID